MQNTSFATDFPYLYRGIVIDNEDPKNLGRCKIQIPSIHGGGDILPSYLPWARGISNIVIGETKGSSSIPDVGDIVWVLFEGGEDDYPVYIGGLQGTKDIPITRDEVVLYQENGNRIVYNRANSSFTMTINGNHIVVGSGIDIKGSSIHIEGPVTIEGSTSITGPVTVTGSTSITGPVSISGGVGISGTVNVSGALYVNGRHVCLDHYY